MTTQQLADVHLSLSRFASVVLAEGEARVRSLLSDSGLASDDPTLLLVLQAFSRARRTKDLTEDLGGLVSADDLDRIVEKLFDVGLLVSEAEDACAWEPHDLAFHEASTTVTQTVKRSGSATVPSVRPRASSPTTPLTRCIETTVSAVDAIRARRSTRQFTQAAIPFVRFGSLLDLAVAELIDVHGQPTGRRPYPSGGGVYALDVYAVLAGNVVTEIDPGIYRYSPIRHELELVTANVEACTYLADAAAALIGQEQNMTGAFAVLLITSRYRRICEAYRQVPYRLALLEVGCLMQSIYLAAASVGLGACALGGVPRHELLADWLGLDRLEEPALGQMVVGQPRSVDQ